MPKGLPKRLENKQDIKKDYIYIQVLREQQHDEKVIKGLTVLLGLLSSALKEN